MKDLEAAGLLASEISIVASNADNWYATTKHDRDRDGVDDRAEGAATGATIGAATGGLAGLLAGFGLLAYRELDPLWRPDRLPLRPPSPRPAAWAAAPS